ncbi:MAG: sigma 54-interacting transcriptional regulator [Coriobacteriales bacterium]|jgi:transcriptional regulator with PAS, ATPase and Fis domain|nr:sigma 54-interacting transcriptional regulator [Coriobacteriales bacterium]
MPLDYDSVALAALKENVTSDPTAPVPDCYRHLGREWRRSLALTGDRHLQRLNDEQRDLSVFENLDEKHFAHLDYLKDYYEAKQEFLASIGAAMLCLDGNYSVFYKEGNRELLATLKDRGIRMGTCFSEQSVGIFVANIAHHIPFKTIFRIGEENYLDIFCDLVCYARFGIVESSGFSTINIIFLPVELHNQQVHESILYALDVEDLSFKNRFMYPAIEQKINLLEKSLELALDAFLLVNDKGEVVFADALFKKEFWDPGELVRGIPLQEFMPPLKPYLACLKGKTRVPREVFAANGMGTSRFYPIRCQQITEDGHIIGLKLSIVSKQSPRRFKPQAALFTFDDLKGNSRPLTDAKEMGLRAAESPSTVLITGESGTGKEMFAHAIHNASDRKGAPFIPINCGAIPKELIGSELFGHARDSRGGSRKEGSPGKFEQGQGGTVFLDEVAEMPLDMQNALLRFLEDGVILRIGSKKSLKLDVRIIAASNKNLWESVNQGMFRLDLYFRLNVLRIELPPLRNLQDDIGLLMRHFLDSLAERMGKEPLAIDPKVVELFAGYTWPGNLRELRNILERCVNIVDSDRLTLDALPPDIVQLLLANPADQRRAAEHAKKLSTSSYTLPSALPAQYAAIPSYHDFEVGNIRALMLEFKGNKSTVAKKLGISRATLYRKLAEMGY